MTDPFVSHLCYFGSWPHPEFPNSSGNPQKAPQNPQKPFFDIFNISPQNFSAFAHFFFPTLCFAGLFGGNCPIWMPWKLFDYKWALFWKSISINRFLSFFKDGLHLFLQPAASSGQLFLRNSLEDSPPPKVGKIFSIQTYGHILLIWIY